MRQVAIAAVWLLSCGVCAAQRCTVRPVDNGAELTNPDMGWVLHYYDNVPKNYGSKLAPSDLLPDWPGLSLIYLRIPWAYVEPAEGEYNWSVVDTPMQRFAERGLKAAFRFTCSESWMEYPTPKWVQDAGAKGYRFKPGKGIVEDGPFWEPDFDDPVFLEKLGNFLAAAAARYDGHPDVAFIDIGSFGVWGEGHTWSSTRKAYPSTTIKRHVELHREHFKKTLLVAIDDFLSRPGALPVWSESDVSERPFDMVVPMAWRGKTYALRAGLWQRGRKENAGRLLPLNGDPDRTVRLGELRIAEDGELFFSPTAEALPGAEALTDGAEFAMICPRLDYDRIDQPNSAKVILQVRSAAQLSADVYPFVHVFDPETGKQVFVLREEREDEELTNYLAQSGLGLRDDSILVQPKAAAYFHGKMAQTFWPNVPVILESEHYGGSAARGCWGDGSGFLQAVEDYHASCVSIHWWPHEFLEKNRELVRRINSRVGYRFVPDVVSWPEHVRIGEELALSWRWKNAGVAPSYTPVYPAVTLKDEAGGIAAVFVDDHLGLHQLPVGLPREAPVQDSSRMFALPFQLKTGAYDVFISVGDVLGRPTVALPLEGGDGKRRYRLGSCEVRGDFSCSVSSATVDGGCLELSLAWQLHRDLSPTTAPFLHLNRGNHIVEGAGAPEGVPAGRFSAAAEFTAAHRIDLPKLKPGDCLTVFSGLWQPERQGSSGERHVPDHDAGGRRTRLGLIRCLQTGATVFEAEPGR